jgi:photosystem II PsbW protein
MAAVSVSALSHSPAACLVRKDVATSSTARTATVHGLPALRTSRLVCSVEKQTVNETPKLAASAASFAAFAAANPGAAFALVDERLSTEGTGLGLGLSNPKLAWILIGVTTLIWALYFVYASGLPEGDDDSGLSL